MSSGSRAQRIAIIAIVACAVAAAFFGVLQVKRHHELIRYSYELSEVSESLRNEESENRRLRLERSLLSSPKRLEGLAAELGLVHPSPNQIRVIELRAAGEVTP